MVLESFPTISIMHGTTVSIRIFQPCSEPLKDNRSMMRWQKAPRPSPHSAPNPSNPHYRTSVEPPEDELYTSVKSRADAGRILPLTTPYSIS